MVRKTIKINKLAIKIGGKVFLKIVLLKYDKYKLN